MPPSEARQYVEVGDLTVPESITVFAMRMREHMQVTTAFLASMIDPEVVRRASGYPRADRRTGRAAAGGWG